jgi:hypothetical protein
LNIGRLNTLHIASPGPAANCSKKMLRNTVEANSGKSDKVGLLLPLITRQILRSPIVLTKTATLFDCFSVFIKQFPLDTLFGFLLGQDRSAGIDSASFGLMNDR